MSILRTISTFVLAMLPIFGFAQTLKNPIPVVGDLPELIALLIDAFMFVVMPIVVIAIIYGGYVLVTANGNDKDIDKGKAIILWTLVGAAIIVSAKVLATIITGTVENLNP